MQSVKAVIEVERSYLCPDARPWRARGWVYDDGAPAAFDPDTKTWTGHPRSMWDSCHGTRDAAQQTVSTFVRARLGK